MSKYLYRAYSDDMPEWGSHVARTLPELLELIWRSFACYGTGDLDLVKSIEDALTLGADKMIYAAPGASVIIQRVTYTSLKRDMHAAAKADPAGFSELLRQPGILPPDMDIVP